MKVRLNQQRKELPPGFPEYDERVEFELDVTNTDRGVVGEVISIHGKFVRVQWPGGSTSTVATDYLNEVKT